MGESYVLNDEKFNEILENSYIDPLKDVSYPPTAISYGIVHNIPVSIGTYGNFSFVQAPPKSKKTFFLSLIASAYCGAKTEFTHKMLGFKGNKKLIHYDTEQGSFHAQKVFSRVFKMCDKVQGYETYALRQYSPIERLAFIDWHLNRTDDVGLVIIDGIADLVNDSNDLVESSRVTQYLMKWTQELGIHVVTAIHSNWNSDKPTGHLGSFLEKKAETQIALEVLDKNNVLVKCKRSRGFSFEDFAFKVDNHGLPRILQDIPEKINGDRYISI